LVSAKDTLLGTVTIPEYWAQRIERDRIYEFMYAPSIPVVPYNTLDLANMNFTVYKGVLELAQYSQYRNALLLWYLTPEQFEQIDGCAFSPGAGYIRSLV
jgi:hypothetical protein